MCVHCIVHKPFVHVYLTLNRGLTEGVADRRQTERVRERERERERESERERGEREIKFMRVAMSADTRPTNTRGNIFMVH